MERAVLPMARAALDAGQVETARRLYRRVLQVDSASVDARMGLGDAAVATRESAEAARWYLAALANARRPEERHAALLAHGRAALSAGQLEAARKSFARLIEPDEQAPQSVVAWGFNGLGLTLLLAGDVRGGVAAMEQAVLRTPDDARFQGNLTRALAMLTELDDPSGDPRAADAIARAREPMPPIETLPGVEPVPSPSGGPRPPLPEAPAPVEPVAVEPVAVEPVAVQDGASPTDRAVPPAHETSTPVAASGDPEPPDAAVPPHDEPREPAARTLPEPPPAPPRVATATDLPDPSEPEAPQTPEAPSARPADREDEPDLPDTSGQQPIVLQEDAWTIVQPAAYRSRARAERLSERLRELTDHPVWVSEGASPGGATLSRVRIGPIPSRDALLALGTTLEAEGFEPLNLRPRRGKRGLRPARPRSWSRRTANVTCRRGPTR